MMRECLGAVAALALALAGCGGSDSSPGGPTGSSPPAAPAPAAHAAPDLEAPLPDEVDGVRLTKASATGTALLGRDAFSRELTRFLAAAGRTPADLRFANARDPSQALDVEVGVFEARGVDGGALGAAVVAASRPSAPGLRVSTAVLAGKRVTTLVYATGSTLYLYEHDDRVFYVGTRSETLASEVLATFP
jgi:hypothetical protein